MNSSPQIVGGTKVVISPDRPRFEFPKEWVLPCGERLVFTDARVAEINAWALRVCGTTNVIADGVVLRIDSRHLAFDFGFDRWRSDHAVMMNPRTCTKLRRTLAGLL